MEAAPRSEQRRLALRLLGILAVLGSLIGVIVWTAGYSPLGFQRFEILDGGRFLSFRQAGEYVVYDERPLRSDGTPAGGELTIVVQSDEGRPVEVSEVSGDHGLVLYNGRAVGRFDLDEPGTYVVRANAAAPVGVLDNATVAVAQARSTTWLGSLWGLVAVCFLPGVGGVAALVVSRRRDRADLDVG